MVVNPTISYYAFLTLQKEYTIDMFPSVLNTTSTSIAITVTPKILWIGFGVVFVFATVMSIVLLYHWSHYGYKPVKTGIMGALYFVGVLVLLGVVFFSIISYLASL